MAFADTNLQHISFPKTLEKMGVQSFAQCKGLFDVELNEGLKTIPEYCFYGCTDLQSIHIPTTVKSIEKHAFARCEKLSNVYYDGDAKDVKRDITCFEDCPASALSLNAKEEKTEVIDGTSYSVLEGPKRRTLKEIAESIGIIRNRQKDEKEK